MRALFGLYAEGKLAPRITARYGLAEVPDALAAMERREVKGKVIIEPQR
jgi:NADPH2:quinone reductase